jgi:hypothetical protein
MNKIIRKKNENYTIVSNVCVRDNRISLKAKGLMSLVMSLPDDWDFSIQGLSSIVKEGKSAIYAAINELKEFGYCNVITSRDDKGKIIGNDYTFFEEPCTDIPYTENQDTDNPNMDNQDLENQPQINKDIKEIKTEILKETDSKEKELQEFVDKVYAMYPSKCPVRKTYLGKCAKDKDRIRKLLKTYTEEDIIKVVEREISEKYGKHYMQNFSTFLNNFPDPNSLFDDKASGNVNEMPSNDGIVVNGQIYR